MKKEEIRVGGFYLAKVNNKVVVVEVLSITATPGSRLSKSGTRYFVKNTVTGRTTWFYSASKFRGEAKRPDVIDTLSEGKLDGASTTISPHQTGMIVIEGGELVDAVTKQKVEVSDPHAEGMEDQGKPSEGEDSSDPTPTTEPMTDYDSHSSIGSTGSEPSQTEGEQSADPMSSGAPTEPYSGGETSEPAMYLELWQPPAIPPELPPLSKTQRDNIRESVRRDTVTITGPYDDVRPKGATLHTGERHSPEEMMKVVDEIATSVVPKVSSRDSTPPTVLNQPLDKRDHDVLSEMLKVGEPGLITNYPDSVKATMEVPNPPTNPPISPQKSGEGISVLQRKLKRLTGEQAELAGSASSTKHDRVLGGEEGTPVHGGKLVKRDQQHLVVRARAGTGKTTTLIEGMKQVMGIQSDLTPSDQQNEVWCRMAQSVGARSVGFVAFNSSIANELKRRVPQGAQAMTMHSMGFKAVSRCFNLSGQDVTNKNKVEEVVCQLLGIDLRLLRQTRPNLLNPLKHIVKLCKMRLVGVDPSNNRFDVAATDWGREIGNIINHYDIDVEETDDEEVYELIPRILEVCRNPTSGPGAGCIDFDDQIWLAVITPGIRLWEYDVLCVDEGQDLNPAQQALVLKSARRMVLCGDDRQAIYGFTGADVDGLPNMQSKLDKTSKGCELLPLTVTRRCGKAIVEEARKIVPDFEAHESNGPGCVGSARYPIQRDAGSYWTGGGQTRRLPWDQTYLRDVEPGDLVICRVNSHLVSQCTEHHKRGNRAFILGREYGEQYRAFVERFDARDVPSLVSMVSDWRAEELVKENARRNPSDSRILNIEGKADTVLALCEGMNSVTDVIARVDALFVSDPNRPGVLHSSIHKAKGLEANNVWFLMPKGGECPHPMAKTTWARRQEENLLYVGITRAIDTQTFVS